MAITKFTALFHQQTGEDNSERFCGWSETWYVNAGLSAVDGLFQGFAKDRAAILTRAARIIGFRYSELGGPTKLSPVSERGVIASYQDIPMSALNCECRNADKSRTKYFQLRGLPDDNSKKGKYAPDAPFQRGWERYVSGIIRNGLCFLGYDKAKPQVAINSVSALGLLKCAAGATFVDNNTVIIRRCRNLAGKKATGRFRIVERISDREFLLANWTGGEVGASGTVAVFSPIALPVGDGTVKYRDVTTRKVGRPFNLYRGRATKR